MASAVEYVGPQCPRCGVTLVLATVQQGETICEQCEGFFEATLFQPPERRRPQMIETVVVAGPEGANACANHARNAAVTSCQRCGLFICSLCDMNVGAGSYCPSCFDRVRSEGTLKAAPRKYRDYASIARLTAVIGLLAYFAWPLVGAVSLYFVPKGFRQRRAQGRSGAGMVVVGLLAVAEILGGIALYGFMFWSIVKAGK